MPPKSGFKKLAVLVAMAAILCSLSACFAPRPFDETAWEKTAASQDAAKLRAPHTGPDGRFFNPWQPENAKSFWTLLYWFLSEPSISPDPGEIPPTPTVPNDGKYLGDPNSPDSLTWVGHATFVLQWSGQVVVTDPFFSDRAAVVSRLVQPPFGPGAIPKGAIVLISHNHYDHLDSDSVAALGDKALFLCPLGLAGPLREMGAKDVQEFDWWQSFEIGGTRFTALPVQHWSRRFGQPHNTTLWCAWMMENKGRKVFYGADSGYFAGFKEFGRLWPGIELALMPVGAYEPRWFMHYAHMNIKEVLKAFDDLGAKVMVPTQWGVLELGDEPAVWPMVELRRAVKADPGLAHKIEIMPVGGRLMLAPVFSPGARP